MMKNNDVKFFPSIGIRLLAFLIDAIAIYIVWFLVVILPLLVRGINIQGYNFQFEFMIGVFISWIYFSIFYHKAEGKTFGNRFFRLKIIRYSSLPDEARLRVIESMGRAFLMSLILFIKAFTWPIPLVIVLMYIEFWWTGLFIKKAQGKRRFGWDYLSNSIVIREVKKNAS